MVPNAARKSVGKLLPSLRRVVELRTHIQETFVRLPSQQVLLEKILVSTIRPGTDREMA